MLVERPAHSCKCLQLSLIYSSRAVLRMPFWMWDPLFKERKHCPNQSRKRNPAQKDMSVCGVFWGPGGCESVSSCPSRRTPGPTGCLFALSHGECRTHRVHSQEKGPQGAHQTSSTHPHPGTTPRTRTCVKPAELLNTPGLRVLADRCVGSPAPKDSHAGSSVKTHGWWRAPAPMQTPPRSAVGQRPCRPRLSPADLAGPTWGSHTQS